jgi:Ca2+-binding EF-hand superfamily protein
MKKFVPTLLICLLAGIPAHGQGQKSVAPEVDEASRRGEMDRLAQKKSNDNFEAADGDKNGVLSRAEVAKHFPFFDQNFERYDKNKDGTLSWEEFVGHDKWKRPIKDK